MHGYIMDRKETELPQETLWTLERADGYLDLGMAEKARAELQSLRPQHASTRPFLDVELRLAMLDKNWACALAAVAHLKELAPKEPSYWVQWAYIIRRTSSIEEARTILLDAQRRFRKVAIIPYNLACYECQLGRHEEALSYLQRAITMDSSLGDLALEDEDLKPVWSRIE